MDVYYIKMALNKNKIYTKTESF